RWRAVGILHGSPVEVDCSYGEIAGAIVRTDLVVEQQRNRGRVRGIIESGAAVVEGERWRATRDRSGAADDYRYLNRLPSADVPRAWLCANGLDDFRIGSTQKRDEAVAIGDAHRHNRVGVIAKQLIFIAYAVNVTQNQVGIGPCGVAVDSGMRAHKWG